MEKITNITGTLDTYYLDVRDRTNGEKYAHISLRIKDSSGEIFKVNYNTTRDVSVVDALEDAKTLNDIITIECEEKTGRFENKPYTVFNPTKNGTATLIELGYKYAMTENEISERNRDLMQK